MKIIAITGSIGCGKTFIANILKSMGYDIFDADKTVKYFYYNKKFINIIKHKFPESFDEKGVFVKRKLRNIVFGNKNKLKELENLIHPLLKDNLKKKIRKKCKTSDFLFFDVALLYEMNWDIYCDYVILADVDKNIQKQRVIKRDNITEEDFKKIYELQINNDLKKNMVDVIINTGYSEGIIKLKLIDFLKDIS